MNKQDKIKFWKDNRTPNICSVCKIETKVLVTYKNKKHCRKCFFTRED